jgi:hypothetical protein
MSSFLMSYQRVLPNSDLFTICTDLCSHLIPCYAIYTKYKCWLFLNARPTAYILLCLLRNMMMMMIMNGNFTRLFIVLCNLWYMYHWPHVEGCLVVHEVTWEL